MMARILTWLLRHEPVITWATVCVLALALMGQLDGMVP